MGNKNRQSGESVYTDCQYVGIGMGERWGASFRSGPNPAWWCYAAEHLIVWLLCHMLINHFYG